MAKTTTRKRAHPGIRQLIKQCDHMRRAYDLTGPAPARELDAGFAALLRIIVDQQVSTHAGAAIWRKLEATLGGPVEPDRVIAIGEEGLRASGFSRGKTRYALGLADAVASGTLDLEGLSTRPDDEATAALTAIKGIGRWTAEIYLMFALGRPDIMPSGDLALQIGAQLLLGLPARPSIKELDREAERWRPYRSAAAVMLWQYYRYAKPGRGGQPAGS